MHDFKHLATSTSSVGSVIYLPFISSRNSTAFSLAYSYPLIIKLEWSPILIKLSAYSSNSPANVITKFVLSPHSFWNL